MSYEPEVNDYVIWEVDTWNGKMIDEGWVYFKCDEYITIETHVKPKPKCQYTKNERHKFIHTLLLCHNWNWSQLKYVKSRKSKSDNEPAP